MTTIWIDSRKRAAGRDEDFEFDIGETVHLQGSARLGVFKIRVAEHRPRHLPLLEGHGPRHSELGAAPHGRLHRRAPGRVDQQQLRERPASWRAAARSSPSRR